MSEIDREEIERNKLATTLAPLVAEKIRPGMRVDMWSCCMVCAFIAGLVAYLLSRIDVDGLRDEIRDKNQKPVTQTNVLNIERESTQVDLQREILIQQGHIKGSEK